MALPVVIPNTFANANASIPLSQLDNNFSTVAVAINGMANGAEALANVNITGGSIANASLSNVSISSGNVTINVANVTTLDATNVEVTNIKAKDGTASATIADSTGVMTIGSSVLTTTDINGGTIDATAIGGSTPAAGAFTTVSATGVATFAAGSVSLPSITTTGDTNTGIYFPAADSVAVSTAGSEAMRIDSAGNVGIGGASQTANKLYLAGTISGATTAYGVLVSPTFSSDATANVFGARTNLTLPSAASSLTSLYHYAARLASIGTTTVTDQYGFLAESSLIGATNNYGFYGNIAAGTGRYNFAAVGTAANYFSGVVGIGSLNTGGGGSGCSIRFANNLTGGVSAISTFGTPQVQSDVTTIAVIYSSTPTTQAAAFTLGSLFHYNAAQGTLGAGSTITIQTGFYAASNLIGATNNYGFRGVIPSGTNRFNLYMDGTANNYLAGALGIGTSSPNASALLDVQSTTKGVRMPNMTTTQKNAIASPAAGLMVYDTTLAKLCVYTTAWETITSV